MSLLKKYCLLLFAFISIQKINAQSTIPATLLCCQTEINGDVTLTWSASPEACGAFVEYDVYYSSNYSGPYTQFLPPILGIGTTTFTHIGAGGATNTWYYYVVAVYSCPGYTMTTSDTLDNLDPVEPVIDYVTVTANQSQLFWFPSPSPETNAYIIYRDNLGFVPIDTVWGRFTNTYTDLTGSPGTKVETYTIASKDSCDNVGPFSTQSHHTIYLTAQQLNCSDTIELSWNLYDTWTAGLNKYEVWVDLNGAGSVPVATLSNTTTNYSLSGINDGDQVCITIHGFRNDGTAVSVSNEYCQTMNIVQPSAYNVMRNATVNSSTQIVIEWYPDMSADIEKFSVQRSEDNIAYSNLITATISPITLVETYTDNSVSANSKSYYYKTISIDSCDKEVATGYVRTVLLKGNDNANFTNTINWNNFEITNGNVTEYKIYRDEGAGFNYLTSVSGANISYIDDVSSFVNLIDEFCYQVEAIYNLNSPDNGVNEQLSSFSNSVCVEQGPRIYVPNAIVPDGLNSIFKPVIVYGSEEGYSMKIFDRYGQNIFETSDVNEGWTGVFKNEIVPMGTYAYLISFTATNGQLITKKGNVTVVR